MSELGDLVYEVGNVKVSRLAVTVGDKVHPLEGIALASVEKSSNLWTGIVIAVIAGAAGLLMLVTGNTQGICLGMAGVGVFIGVVMAVMGANLWQVNAVDAAGKSKRLWSGPQEQAEALAEAINVAKTRIIE